MTISSELFRKPPIHIVDGIPVFSEADRYVENYVKIASDHIAAMTPGHDNPYIANRLWTELEASTRSMVEKYTKAGDRVLDVGVGLGRMLEPLAHLDRFGIDLSHAYLTRCRDKGISVALAKIEDMPFVDEAFDCVVSSDVLEHVFDLYLCTREILRVLKPGGHLVVRVPYREDLNVYLQEGLPYEFIHVRSFDEDFVRLHFEKIFSCEVLEVSPVVPYWQGRTRLRLKSQGKQGSLAKWLATGGRKRLRWNVRALRMLRRISAYDEEEVVSWLDRLLADDPDTFNEVLPHLVLEIEMNFVVRKPCR